MRSRDYEWACWQISSNINLFTQRHKQKPDRINLGLYWLEILGLDKFIHSYKLCFGEIPMSVDPIDPEAFSLLIEDKGDFYGPREVIGARMEQSLKYK